MVNQVTKLKVNGKGDTYFYSEFDETTGYYCVFGDNSGHPYHRTSYVDQSEEEAIRMTIDQHGIPFEEVMARFHAQG